MQPENKHKITINGLIDNMQRENTHQITINGLIDNMQPENKHHNIILYIGKYV